MAELVPGTVEDNPGIVEQVAEEASIKNPQQQQYADVNAARRAETIAKNKAHAADDAFEATQTNGVYGGLTERSRKIQELLTRDVKVPTAEDVANAYHELEDASREAFEVTQNSPVDVTARPV